MWTPSRKAASRIRSIDGISDMNDSVFYWTYDESGIRNRGDGVGSESYREPVSECHWLSRLLDCSIASNVAPCAPNEEYLPVKIKLAPPMSSPTSNTIALLGRPLR